MKLTMRNGVWETNSSSVHSITVTEKGLRKCHLKPRADGYIHVELRYFGKDDELFYGQKDKLAYLLTCVAYMCGCGYGCAISEDYERFYGSYQFQYVEEAVMHYIAEHNPEMQVKGIRVDKLEKAEIDHQSIPEYGEFPIGVSIWNEKSMQDFIFNSYVALHTDCD